MGISQGRERDDGGDDGVGYKKRDRSLMSSYRLFVYLRDAHTYTHTLSG